MNTRFINLDEIETTNSIMNAVETGEILKFRKANDSQKRALFLQVVEFGEIGYERKSDWMRLVNKLNSYDETPIKRMITGDKKSLDWGGVVISRTDITYSEDGFLLEFTEPVELLIETMGEKAIVIRVSKLKGEITYEWFHRNSHNEELGNYAGILEISIHNVEILN